MNVLAKVRKFRNLVDPSFSSVSQSSVCVCALIRKLIIRRPRSMTLLSPRTSVRPFPPCRRLAGWPQSMTPRR